MSRNLSEGMAGPDVRALQDVLNFHIQRASELDGALNGALEVDGDFGPKTQSRVVDFQIANDLPVDGIVGDKTNEQLFEVTELSVPLVFLPTLQLNPLQFGEIEKFGDQLPKLVPQLQWPGPPMPPPFPFGVGESFVLFPNSLGRLPALRGPASALGLKVTMPTRKDPSDPLVANRKAIVELIDDLPVNTKFRGFLISQVPNSATRVALPPFSFNWGVAPLFNPSNPTGFSVKGNSQYTLHLTDAGQGMPNLVFGAWGDGKFLLNFDIRRGHARSTVQAEGQVYLGVKGVF